MGLLKSSFLSSLQVRNRFFQKQILSGHIRGRRSKHEGASLKTFPCQSHEIGIKLYNPSTFASIKLPAYHNLTEIRIQVPLLLSARLFTTYLAILLLKL